MDGCVILLAKSFLLEPSNWWAMFQVLVGLGAVIFVHELGHFLLAKACGVKCDKFYVGFDVPIRLFGQTIIPGKLVSWTWGETEYGIGSIPLGGYVKMMGQDDNPGNLEEQLKESVADGESPDEAFLESGLVDRSKLDPRSYLAKSVIQRMLIISAGVIFNLIFAVLFAALAFKSGVDYEPPVIGNVKGSGPAWIHDMTGAEILGIGDKPVVDYFTYMDFAQEVVFHGDEEPLRIKFKRYGSDEIVEAEMTPQKGYVREAKDLPLIGVSVRMTPVIGKMGAIKGNAADLADPPLEPGDVIVEVNGHPIKTDIDLRMALRATPIRKPRLCLSVKRGKWAKASRPSRPRFRPTPCGRLDSLSSGYPSLQSSSARQQNMQTSRSAMKSSPSTGSPEVISSRWTSV